MQIKTTGIEQYMPGGEARLQLMVIGGPGVGKTRWSSYWPKPIYANIEAGLSSVADRNVPYADISNSDDMLTFLKGLKRECMKPMKDRRWHTAVIDTLDAFQRKVKDEYMQAHPNMESFRGYDAWGYLDTKMQMLMTRLLNLDMNVIVLVHYKDKTITEGSGEAKTERLERMLQLQGDIKDSAFNDFDLVGWMDTYWAVDENNERVQKRGITFTADPERPFLKDRLHITPKWLPVTFSEDDYSELFSRYSSRFDALPEGATVDEIEEMDGEPEADVPAPSAEGVAPPDLPGGPLPPQEQRGPILSDMKRAELLQMARELDVDAKANTLKADLIQMIESRQEEIEQQAKEEMAEDAAQATQDEASGEAEQTDVQGEEVADSKPLTVEEAIAGNDQLANDNGRAVDKDTGEILTPEQVAEMLGAEIVQDEQDEPEPEPQKAEGDDLPLVKVPGNMRRPPARCEHDECEQVLASEGQNPNYVVLSEARYRKYLCNQHFLAEKRARAAK